MAPREPCPLHGVRVMCDARRRRKRARRDVSCRVVSYPVVVCSHPSGTRIRFRCPPYLVESDLMTRVHTWSTTSPSGRPTVPITQYHSRRTRTTKTVCAHTPGAQEGGGGGTKARLGIPAPPARSRALKAQGGRIGCRRVARAHTHTRPREHVQVQYST